MSRARTPVNFPRMKIRGAGNKARSAERTTQVWEALVRIDHAEGTTVRMIVDPIFGTHLVRNTVVRDGWGRTVTA